VVGAQALGELAGFPDLITFDMSGISTDVALLQSGQYRAAAGEATVHGYSIKAPMLDINMVARAAVRSRSSMRAACSRSAHARAALPRGRSATTGATRSRLYRSHDGQAFA
jgi:hypothetical protein